MSARPPGEVVFQATSSDDSLFDLFIDRRIGETDIAQGEFGSALGRRRVPPGTRVLVRTWDGHTSEYDAFW